ncbi:MAG: DUF1993 domain-containing protein [Rhizomicrobium sp.]
MAFTLYDALIPPLTHMLGGYLSILGKAEAHAKEKGEKVDSYLELRLAPDMLPLTKQVQIATDMAKGGAARLAGAEIPSYADNETTVAELKERLKTTIAFLKSLDAGKFQGAETREIHLKFPQRELHFNGKDYLNDFVLPNFYFHVTTGYDILRHKGVALGKQDFLGG